MDATYTVKGINVDCPFASHVGWASTQAINSSGGRRLQILFRRRPSPTPALLAAPRGGARRSVAGGASPPTRQWGRCRVLVVIAATTVLDASGEPPVENERLSAAEGGRVSRPMCSAASPWSPSPTSRKLEPNDSAAAEPTLEPKGVSWSRVPPLLLIGAERAITVDSRDCIRGIHRRAGCIAADLHSACSPVFSEANTLSSGYQVSSVLCNLNCPGCHQLVASEENLDLPNIKDVRGKEPVSIPHLAGRERRQSRSHMWLHFSLFLHINWRSTTALSLDSL
jgi:hypothetical protein